MAREFRVNLPELDSVIADLSKFDQDAEAVSADVGKLVDDLRIGWTGDAAQAQRDAHDRWKHGAEEMRTALSDLHEVAKTAHENYSGAVAANVGMWPA